MSVVKLAAPFYLHPAESPGAWEALLAGRLGLAFAVINVSNGPGPDPDPYYGPLLARPSAIPLVGYVHVSYGDRSATSVLADARRWRELYGITDIFLDEIPSGRTRLNWDLALIDTLRQQGVRRVIANPGTHPDPGLLRRADLTCVSEQNWEVYRATTPRALLRRRASGERLWHIVHDVPQRDWPRALRLAHAAGAGYLWLTDAVLPNPWRTLPPYLAELSAAASGRRA